MNNTRLWEACGEVNSTPASPVYLQYKAVVDMYVVAAICLFGVTGNVLSIVVLHRDAGRHRTTTWLLKTLAAVDTVYLVTCVYIQPVKTAYALAESPPPAAIIRFEPYVWVVASTAQTTTVWMVMLVTFDRYVAICRPLERHLRSQERARRAVILVTVAAILYNVPRFFERAVSECDNGDAIVLQVKKTSLAKNQAYFVIYKTLLYFMFRAFGPLVSLIVLNARLVLALRVVRKKHRARKTTAAARSSHHENLTLMLIVVVTVFFMCEIPDMVLRLVLTARHLGLHNVPLASLRYVNTLTNMLLTINSSVNFIIYCLIGKRFRQTLLAIFCYAPEPIPNGGMTHISEGMPTAHTICLKPIGGSRHSTPSTESMKLQKDPINVAETRDC